MPSRNNRKIIKNMSQLTNYLILNSKDIWTIPTLISITSKKR